MSQRFSVSPSVFGIAAFSPLCYALAADSKSHAHHHHHHHSKSNVPTIDPVANYPYLTDKHKSLMAQALRANPDLYARYCNIRTASGYTFDQAIQAGLDATHLLVGVVAGDEECYSLYRDMMDFVVERWHGYKSTDQHRTDLDTNHLAMTPEQEAKFDKHIVSTRVRSGRNIKGLPLPPGANRQQRRLIEKIVSTAVGQFTGILQGTYFPLCGMTEQEEKQLIDDHFLFQKPSPRQVLAVCGAARDWPDSRGIFFNEARTFLLWVNEEDQMRIIAMQQGGNVKEVFGRWVAGVDSIERSLRNNGYEFMYDDHFGFLSTCPSNLGTGLRASVMLKVPKLYKLLGVHQFEELCLSMGLQARGERGEHSPPGPNGEFDVSNKARLGFTEVELVQQLIDGVDRLIAMEEALPDN
jgi:creatine kinase